MKCVSVWVWGAALVAICAPLRAFPIPLVRLTGAIILRRMFHVTFAPVSWGSSGWNTGVSHGRLSVYVTTCSLPGIPSLLCRLPLLLLGVLGVPGRPGSLPGLSGIPSGFRLCSRAARWPRFLPVLLWRNDWSCGNLPRHGPVHVWIRPHSSFGRLGAWVRPRTGLALLSRTCAWWSGLQCPVPAVALVTAPVPCSGLDRGLGRVRDRRYTCLFACGPLGPRLRPFAVGPRL